MAKQDPATVYRQCDAATADISAWIVLKNGDLVARIITKTTGRRSPNGLTVRAYVHVLGAPMVRGMARGGGYDMRTAAIYAACQNLKNLEVEHDHKRPGASLHAIATNEQLAKFRGLKDQGYDIPHQLRALGYQVEQAV